jgi:hypothetical protein
MTIRELRRKASEYQIKLRLTEWDIRVVWGRPSDQPDYWADEMDRDCDGNAWWSVEERRAIILLSRASIAPLETLKHELLHLRLEGHHAPEKKRYDQHYEWGLNAIAGAI